MGYYLMKIEEMKGKESFLTNHVIEAEDRQMAKYHYHRTLKDRGYCRSWSDHKHVLEGVSGTFTELVGIEELDATEWYILKKHIPKWTTI